MNINDFQTEEKVRLDPKCWAGKKIGNPKTKMKGGVRVNNCVPKEGVAEAFGLYGPFTVTINTGERPQSRTKTKKFKREDDAILWAQDWLEDAPQYVFATAEVTDPDGNVVWTTDEQGVAEGQLNEYLVRAGMPVKDVLSLNLFQDTGPDGQEGMADDPRWRRLMKKYQPIANILAKKIIALGKNRRLSDAEAEAVEEVWYDGSDAYDDMEIEYLADYYNMQIETVEDIIAGELQDDIDEGSTEFAGDTEQDQELRNYAQDTADRAREQIKNKMFNTLPKPGEDEPVHEEHMNPEYDDEAGMAENNLETLDRAVQGLDDLINSGDNLPEWCQEKIAVAKSMLVAVWDYMESEESSDEVDPEVDEMFEAMEQLAEEMARRNKVSVDRVWEQFEALPDNVLYETAAWRRKEGKSKTGGLNAKGVASYRRENPGSKLQTAVTTKPSKLKPGSKAAKRRKSFCARMSGVKGPMKKPNGKPTRKALALRKWNC